MNLKKEYRVVWNDAKEVTLLDKFQLTSVTGCLLGFAADTKEKVDTKITELELTVSEEISESWKNVEY